MMISNGKDRHFLLDKSISNNKKHKTKEQKDQRKASKGSSNKPKHNEKCRLPLAPSRSAEACINIMRIATRRHATDGR